MSVTFVVVSVVLLCFRPIFPFSSFQPFLFIGGFHSSALCRSRRELSNVCLLAKLGFDTAENEPSQVCHPPRLDVTAEEPAEALVSPVEERFGRGADEQWLGAGWRSLRSAA